MPRGGRGSRGRLAVLLLVLVSLGLLFAVTPEALAVGASDVEMRPDLRRDRDGSYLLPVGDGERRTIQVVNTGDEPRAVRVYAATADVGVEPGTGVAVGRAGSVGWLPLDASFELDGGASRTVALPIAATRGDVADGSYVALVLEVTASQSLVTEAVTIVRVQRSALLPVAPWLLTLAVLAVATSAAAWGRWSRGGTPRSSDRPVPAGGGER